MTKELKGIQYTAIVLTSIVLLLIVVLISKLVKTRIKNRNYRKKICLGKNLFSNEQKNLNVEVAILPEFPYDKLTVVDEEFIQPRVFSDETQIFDDGALNWPDTYGTIDMTVKYELTSSKLTVAILKGNFVVDAEATVPFHNYIITKAFPMKHSSYQTRVYRTPHPVFNETFEFVVPLEYLLLQSLKFSLWTFDRFSHHEIVADGLLKLSQLERHGLSISREIGVTQRLRLVTKASGTCGEILFSLGYLALTEKLAVIIIEVINLQKIKNEPPDPFVEVALCHGNQTMATRKTSTKVKKQSATFNETLTFDVAVELLHEISLSFSVLSVDKRNNVSGNLGGVFLGPQASGGCFEHWANISNGGKPTARWHKLQKICNH